MVMCRVQKRLKAYAADCVTLSVLAFNIHLLLFLACRKII